MRVAFLGMGIMGRPMAANLVKAGHEVSIWNRTTGKDLEGLNAIYGVRIKDQPVLAIDKVRYYGDVVAAVAAEDEATAFRALAQIPAGRPLVTYVGRVAHEKNIEFLVKVFVEVRRTVPAAMLVIAGEGPARESLRQMTARLGLERDVHFAGYLDRNTALLDCYAAANVFVFASRTETQGLVLLEAMAQGAPIVSTAELGTRSVLKPDCGALVVEEKLQPFAAAVTRLLQDEGLRNELAERGRTYAKTWSSAVMARRLADLYQSLRVSPGSERVVA